MIIYLMLSDCKRDIVALTETWFTENKSACRVLCTPAGYNSSITLVMAAQREVPGSYFGKTYLSTRYLTAIKRPKFCKQKYRKTQNSKPFPSSICANDSHRQPRVLSTCNSVCRCISPNVFLPTLQTLLVFKARFFCLLALHVSTPS